MTRRERALVPVLVFIVLVAAVVGSLGAPLIPTISAVDHVSLTTAQWSLTVALLVGAIAAPVAGRIGDSGHRRVVIAIVIGSTLCGCVLAALPFGFAWLLAGRALQGVSFALAPLGIAVARQALGLVRAAPVIGLLSVTTVTGIGIGYPLSGLVTEHLGLDATFWTGAIVSAVALAAAWWVLPRKEPKINTTFDLIGALVLALWLSGLLVALGEGGRWGWSSPIVIALIAGAALALGCWSLHELRTTAPLVDLRLLANPGVVAAATIIFMVGIGIYPLISLVSRLIQTPTSVGYGFSGSVVMAGLALVPFSVGSFLASKGVTVLMRTMSPTAVSGIGCLIMITSVVWFGASRSGMWELFCVMGLAGLGVGTVFASNPLQIVRSVPSSETGSAMGFNQVVRSIGFAAGSALSATVLEHYTAPGAALPASDGYTTAALLSVVALTIAFGATVAFGRLERRALREPSRSI